MATKALKVLVSDIDAMILREQYGDQLRTTKAVRCYDFARFLFWLKNWVKGNNGTYNEFHKYFELGKIVASESEVYQVWSKLKPAISDAT